MTLDDKILDAFIKHNIITSSMTEEQAHQKLCGPWPSRLIDELEALLRTQEDKSEDPIKQNWHWLMLAFVGVMGLVMGVQYLTASNQSLWWLLIALGFMGSGFFGMRTFSKKMAMHKNHSSKVIAQYLVSLTTKSEP